MRTTVVAQLAERAIRSASTPRGVAAASLLFALGAVAFLPRTAGLPSDAPHFQAVVFGHASRDADAFRPFITPAENRSHIGDVIMDVPAWSAHVRPLDLRAPTLSTLKKTADVGHLNGQADTVGPATSLPRYRPPLAAKTPPRCDHEYRPMRDVDLLACNSASDTSDAKPVALQFSPFTRTRPAANIDRAGRTAHQRVKTRHHRL
ncbi:MAG: hypothetical protein AAFO79_05490 [Pseudomonadota bacterium]